MGLKTDIHCINHVVNQNYGSDLRVKFDESPGFWNGFVLWKYKYINVDKFMFYPTFGGRNNRVFAKFSYA